MLDIMYNYIYNISMYILKAWIKTTWCWHPLPLHTWSAPRDVNPTFRTTLPGLQFLRRTRGWKSSPDFWQIKPLHRKSVPNWAARGRNRACDLSVASLRASNYAKSGWPARPYIFVCYMPIAPGPGPTKSKIQTPNWPFGFRILELGFWI